MEAITKCPHCGGILGINLEAVGAPKSAPVTAPTVPQAEPADNVKQALHRLDDAELETFCLDHFPMVLDKFSRGMRRDEKITMILDHCRRKECLGDLEAALRQDKRLR